MLYGLQRGIIVRDLEPEGIKGNERGYRAVLGTLMMGDMHRYMRDDGPLCRGDRLARGGTQRGL